MTLLCTDVDHTYQHANHVECLSQTLPLFVVADHLEVLHGGGPDETPVELPLVAGGGVLLVKVDIRTAGLESCVRREGKHLAGTIGHCLTKLLRCIVYIIENMKVVLIILLLYLDYNEPLQLSNNS